MKNATVGVLFALGFGALTLNAADFWQKKQYAEWDSGDIQKILNDSPWARPVDVYRTGAVAPGGDISGTPPGARVDGMGGGDTGLPGGDSAAPRPAMAGGAPPQAGPAVTPVRLVVRFVTALPVKQALARARYGNEVANSPEAQRSLNALEDSYVVAIFGLEQMPVDAAALTKMASLKVKGKDAFPPERAQADKGAVVLFFARKDHPIAVDDREVEVRLRLPGASIRRSFKLKDMVYNGKLEI